jgi:hypothetical protein
VSTALVQQGVLEDPPDAGRIGTEGRLDAFGQLVTYGVEQLGDP